MTVEIYSEVGDSPSYDSSLYTATVGGSPAAIRAYSRDTTLQTAIWGIGETIEVGWLKFGADATTTVVITPVSGTIYDAQVYPKDTGTTFDVIGGDLTLSVPINTNIRIEINNDRAEVLHIFSCPLAEAVPVTKTDWTTLGQNIVSINAVSFEVTLTGHGWTGGERVHLTTTGTLPTGITRFTAFTISYVDANTFQLLDGAGDLVEIDAGTGTHTVWPSYYTNSASALYFGGGTHDMGIMFDVEDDVTVYIDSDAIVIGNFDLKSADGVIICGSGHLSGEFSTVEALALLGSTARDDYIMFSGQGLKGTFDNLVRGITIFAQPYHSSKEALWSWANVQIISPWSYWSDGPNVAPKEATDLRSAMADLFIYVGDDGCFVNNDDMSITIDRVTSFVTSNTCFQGFYRPDFVDSDNFTAIVTDCHAMNLCGPDSNTAAGGGGLGQPQGASSIIKSWMDGLEANADRGHNNVTFSNLKVWGPLPGRFMAIGNHAYPSSWGTVKDQYGQLHNWELNDIWLESTPGQISLIESKDDDNTPHDIAFSNLEIVDTVVTSSNYTTYFTVDAEVYNLTWGDETEATTGATFTVETGTGETDSNSYCSVATADAYHLDQGNPSAWSGASTLQKEDWLRQATTALDLTCAWCGLSVTSTQALAWPRYYVIDRAGNSIASTTIPTALQYATAMLALELANGNTILQTTETTADISSETNTVGPISKSTTYLGGKPSFTRYPAVTRMLARAGLIEWGGVGWGISAL